MTHRDLNSIVQKLGSFMTTNNACAQAAKSLGRGVEIGITVEGIDCTFFRNAEGPGFEVRKAKNPDVTFKMSPLATDTLCDVHDRTLGELGVEVLKQYLAGEVQVRVNGSLFGIMKNGYLGIIKDAGLPFAKFLAEHGVANISKIPEIIKKLKKKAL